MRRHLFHRRDAFADTGLIDEDLSVPETVLCPSTKDWILPLQGPLFDLVDARLLLLESVHQGHGFVLSRQVLVILAVEQAFVVDRRISLACERLQLELRVLNSQLFRRSALRSHLNDLVERKGLKLLFEFGFLLGILFERHHSVGGGALGSWLPLNRSVFAQSHSRAASFVVEPVFVEVGHHGL